jgi:hypothetical protein
MKRSKFTEALVDGLHHRRTSRYRGSGFRGQVTERPMRRPFCGTRLLSQSCLSKATEDA